MNLHLPQFEKMKFKIEKREACILNLWDVYIENKIAWVSVPIAHFPTFETARNYVRKIKNSLKNINNEAKPKKEHVFKKGDKVSFFINDHIAGTVLNIGKDDQITVNWEGPKGGVFKYYPYELVYMSKKEYNSKFRS